jgi:hypothetical protein
MVTTAATDKNGYEWRILLGPTHNWKVREVELRKEEIGPGERCELCGELLDASKPFMTNSAGQQPVHMACSTGEEPATIALRPARKSWVQLLHSFVGT